MITVRGYGTLSYPVFGPWKGVHLAIKIEFDDELNMKHFSNRGKVALRKSCIVTEKGKHQWLNRKERGK